MDRKTPGELKSKQEKVALSTRVKKDTKTRLEHEADKIGTTLSDLTCGILEDYVDWLDRTKKKSKG